MVCLLVAAAVQAAPEALEVTEERKELLPRGKEADGIVGDFLLRNDKVEAVISANLPLRRANMSTFYGAAGITPGCLYDLTPRGANNDQITIFSPASQQGRVSWVRIVKDGREGEAVVETVTTAESNEGLYRKHEYKLRDGWHGVLVTTTLKNEGAEGRAMFVEDRWTNFARSGKFGDITWADAVDPADKAGYAFASIDKGGGGGAPGNVQLDPGQAVTFSRFLAVGASPAHAIGVIAAMRGENSTFATTIRDNDNKPVATAKLAIRPRGAEAKTAFPAYPDADGRISVALPRGEYDVELTDLGRKAVTKSFTLNGESGGVREIVMGPAAGIAFSIRDDRDRSTPCKVQFHGVEGTEQPDLGPPNRAHGCKDQYHSERGDFRVSVPPGTYRVVVTRGIEYGHIERTIVVPAEETIAFTGTLKRQVDTSGWVSADYHNHSTPSGDNVTGTDDRIINIAAEHVEFAPTTEHNRLYDWRPHIEKLKLTDYIQTVPGMELTGSGPHLNSFPFKPEPFKQDNGAPVWNPDPRISAITLRDWQGAEPDRWIQINHPDMAHNFLDRNNDGKFDGGFTGLAELIDGIETQNYRGSNILSGAPFRIEKNAQGKDTVIYNREWIWLQMLNRGHRYAAMAVNDSHSIYGNGVGGWRMYMPSRSDEPREIDWRENSRHAKAGRSVLTTGPFLQVRTTDGVMPGAETRSAGGVRLEVKVQCADWMDIDRVQVLVNGFAEPRLNFTRKTHPKLFQDGVVKFERVIDVPLTHDAHLIVVAIGEGFDLSKGYGTSTQAKIRPCAYHNPIFVDTGNDGFTPNGDTLGWPLPVKKVTLEEARRVLGQ
jgi:hypothetical protein